MTATECVDYRRIVPDNVHLLRFFYEFDRIGSFYPDAVHLEQDRLLERAQRVSGLEPRFPRARLVQLLTDFNRRAGASQATFDNIEKLNRSGSVAVVTGQQPGFLGGPAFTVYKAMTAIRLASLLEENGVPAVPVFWQASDDSDFEEVRSTAFYDQEGEVFSSTCPDGEEGARMVGTRRLEAVEACLDELAGRLAGEHAAEVLELLREAYRPQRTFSEALSAWLVRLFAGQGLIVFDALSDYKPELKGVFVVAVRERDRIVSALEDRVAALRRAGLDPQVNVLESESLLFVVNGDHRYKLDYQDGVYRVRGDNEAPLEPAGLLERVQQDAGAVSPNVLLRPIIQDHLFPTAAYVGGAAEVAYYAQIAAIAPVWGIVPAVFPRLGATVLDPKSQRLLDKYDLQVSDLVTSSLEQLKRRIAAASPARGVLERFEKLEGHLERELGALQSEISSADPPVADMLGKAGEKMRYQLEKVQKRFVANWESREAGSARHLEHLAGRLHPEGKLQERVISFNQLLAEQGLDFTRRLLEALDPFCPGHHVVSP